MRRALPFVMLVQLTACATTATIMTTRGDLEATINGGDDESLLVTNEAGLKRRVLREEVRDIDHPGNVLATVFGIAVGGLALDAAVLVPSGVCGGGLTGAGPGPCIAIGTMGAVSLGLFALGLWEWLTSRNAVLSPPAALDGPLSNVPLAFPLPRPRPGPMTPPPEPMVPPPPPPPPL